MPQAKTIVIGLHLTATETVWICYKGSAVGFELCGPFTGKKFG